MSTPNITEPSIREMPLLKTVGNAVQALGLAITTIMAIGLLLAFTGTLPAPIPFNALIYSSILGGGALITIVGFALRMTFKEQSKPSASVTLATEPTVKASEVSPTVKLAINPVAIITKEHIDSLYTVFHDLYINSVIDRWILLETPIVICMIKDTILILPYDLCIKDQPIKVNYDNKEYKIKLRKDQLFSITNSYKDHKEYKPHMMDKVLFS